MENQDLRSYLKKLTVKELKKEVINVKRRFQVSKLKRREVEDVIIANQQNFNHLFEEEGKIPKKLQGKNDIPPKKLQEKEVKPNVKDNYTLVYFGAGWDFKPLTNPLYKKFDHFIFIDSLPKLNHYERGQQGYEKAKDRESFVKTLEEGAGNKGFKLIDVRKNLLTFKNDHKTLEYYINTTVEEALKDKIIRNKIDKAIWLHVKGFIPHLHGLNVGDLPNLLEDRSKLREL